MTQPGRTPQVARHGLARTVRDTMQAIGMTSDLLDFCVREFMNASFGQLSFSLAQTFADTQAISGERAFQGALQHFAGRTAPASRPSA